MMAKFLNMDDPVTDPKLQSTINAKIGGGLKKKPKGKGPQKADRAAVARAGQAHGFTRATGPEKSAQEASEQGRGQTVPKKQPEAPRRGRPPLNEDMTYWRIYVSPDLRDELNSIRDVEGRRLNDVLQDMLSVYKKQTG